MTLKLFYRNEITDIFVTDISTTYLVKSKKSKMNMFSDLALLDMAAFRVFTKVLIFITTFLSSRA